jgi:hypothetical protein
VGNEILKKKKKKKEPKSKTLRIDKPPVESPLPGRELPRLG